jgi:hypothetical protein
MVFGHNSNAKVGNATFHVQTEDRGESHALIDTTVYYQGRVLHRRTNNYFDLLPLNEDRLQALKLRVDEQHLTVMEEIHSGVLQLAVPQTPAPPSIPVSDDPPVPTSQENIDISTLLDAPPEIPLTPRKLIIELTNAKSWLSGKHATLQLAIKEESGDPVLNAKIDVQVEGAAEHSVFTAESGVDGVAQVEFDMPRITASEAAIVIRAEQSLGHGQLRFALRAKPRVPSL